VEFLNSDVSLLLSHVYSLSIMNIRCILLGGWLDHEQAGQLMTVFVLDVPLLLWRSYIRWTCQPGIVRPLGIML